MTTLIEGLDLPAASALSAYACLLSARYQTRGHRSMMAESRMRNGDKHYFVAFVRGRAGRCLPSTR